MDSVILVLVSGIIATWAIDIWAFFISTVIGQPTTNWGTVGQWLRQIFIGEFVLSSSTNTTPTTFEYVLGWAFHYIVGIVYAALYFLVVLVSLEISPSLLSALIFGVATVLAPWFILQPGLGYGVMASKTINPNKVRFLNLLTHTIFGATLYFGGWIVAEGL